MKRLYRYVGLKADPPEETGRWYYPHLEMNRFAQVAQPIHPKARPFQQSEQWILAFFYNPALQRIVIGAPDGHEHDVCYEIHDNGGRPFLVYVSPERRVAVYRIPRNCYVWEEDWANNEKKQLYTERILDIAATKIWIGNDPAHPGNTILVQDGSSYVFIGQVIYRFVTSDVIQEYFSVVGNNDMPYPVALGLNHAFFMIENDCVPRSRFRPNVDWADAYMDYYGHCEDEFYGEYSGLKAHAVSMAVDMIEP